MRSVFSARLEPSNEFEGGWRWWLSVWFPVAIAILVIAIESTGTFSAENTSSWLRPVFENVVGRISDTGWDNFHHYLRKTGHFVGYGTVGFTFLRAWLHTRARRGISTVLAWRVECTILAILSTAVIASCDEFHQAFLPSRTGTPVDVLLDTSGACTLCLAVWLIFWRSSCADQQEAWNS
jgi:VanZ family protein